MIILKLQKTEQEKEKKILSCDYLKRLFQKTTEKENSDINYVYKNFPILKMKIYKKVIEKEEKINKYTQIIYRQLIIFD